MKKRMSILIVVLLVLILIFSSFANAYANPLAQFVGSQMGRTAMTTVISGMLLKDFTDATMVTWDSVMELVDTTKWYFGSYGDGKYGLSIPKSDIEIISAEIIQQIGGYGAIVSSESTPSWIYNHSSYQPNITIPSTVLSLYDSISAPYKFIIRMSGDKEWHLHWTSGQAYFNGSELTLTPIRYSKYMYNGSTASPIVEKSIIGSIGYYYIVRGSAMQIIPSDDIWNTNYITETGPNFNGWMEQPGNRYIVNVPTTTDGLGNLIVDDVALANQTPDLARVNDRLNELQEVPVNDVETWNPVPPITNPVTDPITDVASESWLDRLWSKFVNLFVLPDDYFIKNFQYLRNEVPMMAFPLQIISDIERMASLSGGYLDDIWADGWGGHHKIVDFQFLRDMLPTFHNFLRGIMFILLLMYNYDQVYKLIRGNSYGFGSSRQEIIPQQIESPFKSLGRS